MWALAASIPDILQYIRTPLALAALILLLGTPIVRQIVGRKGKSNADTQAVLRYGFILGLVFGVLAIAAFVYTATFNREIRISGIVRDETGAGLPFVTVRIAGRDGGVTDDGGNFAFTIPDARAADEYTADVFHEGFLIEHVTLKGRYPQPASVMLRRTPVQMDHILVLPSGLTLRHNLGVPQVEIALSYANPFPNSITLTNIGVTLLSPSGQPIPMLMEAVSLAPGQYGPPLPIWKLDKGDSTTVGYSFFNTNPGFMELEQKVYGELGPKQFTIKGPDPTATLLSQGLVQELRDYMQSQFVWVPGKWEIRATCKVEGHELKTAATFTLSDVEVERMKAITKYYPAALGVAPAWRFWQTADADPVVNVLLSPKSAQD
jgi:hypothetical protein